MQLAKHNSCEFNSQAIEASETPCEGETSCEGLFYAFPSI